jgi:hypothetical protein
LERARAWVERAGWLYSLGDLEQELVAAFPALTVDDRAGLQARAERLGARP